MPLLRRITRETPPDTAAVIVTVVPGPDAVAATASPASPSRSWGCSFCLEDLALHLAGANDPAFTAIKAKYTNVVGGDPRGLPPDRGMELELETGDAPMPRSRPEALVGRCAC